MTKSNSHKSKIIFIISGLVISIAVIFILFIFMLSLNQQNQTEEEIVQPQHRVELQKNSKPDNDIITKNKNEVGKTKSTKNIVYKLDGKTKKYIEEYDPKTNALIKITYFNFNGEKISKIQDLDPQGNLIKQTVYYMNSPNIQNIQYYEPQTQNFFKIEYFEVDGKTISSTAEYNPQKNNNLLKQTFYFSDGKIKAIYIFDPITQNLIKTTFYQPDGKTIHYINEFNAITRKRIKQTNYKLDGTIDTIKNFN